VTWQGAAVYLGVWLAVAIVAAYAFGQIFGWTKR
jgi:hypothetical protein